MVVNGETKAFTKRIKDVLAIVLHTGRMKRLDFLNLHEQQTLQAMAQKVDDIQVLFEGGFTAAERRRALIFPTFMTAASMDAVVTVFGIEVIGTGELTHSQVLGALMGLAIDRSVIGDITVDEKGAFFAACSEFDDFFQTHLTKVGRCDIRLIRQIEPVLRAVQVETLEIIVSSMRLDVIVKALIQGSRGKAEVYLDAGFVRLNHLVDKKPSRLCQVGDLLSIRKQGRFKLNEIKKTTKSGKFVLVVNKSV
ncbi:MAG: YlmH/Sll1252 family protein [Defluviitaleaceae bacterium]|nr:YlmH/Sll1252 family protein [Defluviitaleaceae bacterium]